MVKYHLKCVFLLLLCVFFLKLTTNAQDANKLLEQGKTAWYSQKYDTAQYFLEEAAKNNIPEAYFFLGKLSARGTEKSPPNLIVAKNLWQKAAEANFDMANFYLGKLALKTNEAEAQEYFKKAFPSIEKAAKAGDKEAMYLLLFMYENAWAVKRSYTEAENWGKQALKAENIYAYNPLSALQTELGKYAEAEKNYREALTVFAPEGKEYGEALLGMAEVYYIVGRFAESENAYKQAIAFFRKDIGKNSENYATSLEGLSKLYIDLGEYREAEKLYKYYLRDFFDMGLSEESNDFANLLLGFAEIYIVLEEYETPEEFFYEAQGIYKKNEGKLSQNYINTERNLAELYTLTKDYKNANKKIKNAIKLTKKAGIDCEVCYGRLLIDQGELYLKTGNKKKALEVLQEVLLYAETTVGKEHPLYAETAYALTIFYLSENNKKEAQKYFRWSLESSMAYINEQFPILNDREKNFLYTNIKHNFELFNSFSFFYYPEAEYLLGEVYNHQLFTKALFLNLTNRVRDRILDGDNQELIETYYQWKQQRDDLVYFASLSKEERENLGVDLQVLADQNTEIEKYLALESEAFKNSTEQEIITWKEIQAALQPQQAAIEIIRFRRSFFEEESVSDTAVYYAALILTPNTKENPKLILLDNGYLLENRYFPYYKNVIEHRKIDKYSYDKFWKPIASVLPPNTKRVYFAPDGVYNQMNLNTLRNPETENYLIDEIDLRILNNTKEILRSKEKEKKLSLHASPSRGILIGRPVFNIEGGEQEQQELRADSTLQTFDDVFKKLAKTSWADLIGTEKEVEGIANLLNTNQNWNIATYLGTEATEAQVKAVKSPKLLHIATHGFFIDNINQDKNKVFGVNYEDRLLSQSGTAEAMLRSGVVLAGVTNYYQNLGTASGEDGILTAYEAMNLDLHNTDLVVFSACETGVGEVQTGEGVYGLQRALKVAGAKTIMMSLWKVDDITTQELMQVFYEEWAKAGDKRTAFRKAQKLIRDKYNHPYYWGAFIMVGE